MGKDGENNTDVPRKKRIWGRMEKIIRMFSVRREYGEGWRKIRNEVLHNLCSSSAVIIVM